MLIQPLEQRHQLKPKCTWPAVFVVVLMAQTFAVLSAWAQTGGADDKSDDPSRELRPRGVTLQEGSTARMLNRAIPYYPVSARRRGQEGWVQLSFSVLPDGTVANPIVEDSSGIAELEKAAIRALLKSRYTPATWKGHSIEQCATKQMYNFRIYPSEGDRPELGARREFQDAYKEIVALAKDKRAGDAEAKLDALKEKGAWNHYESARLWLVRASLQIDRGDLTAALRSVNRAVVFDGEYLEKDVYRVVLNQKFRLEVSLRNYSAALDSYDKIKILKPPLDDPTIDAAAANIRGIVDGPNSLAFPGILEYRSGCEEGRPNYQHELLRPKFAFSNVEGKVDDFELRCDWRRVSDKVTTEKAWEIPTSWGWCQLFVFGNVGAKVTVVEYPFSDSAQQERLKPAPTP